MCKLGDIIVVTHFKGEDNVKLDSHSFIVVEDNGGSIKGLDYDFVAPIMSSFKNKKHKKKILSYDVNKEVSNKDILGNFKLRKPSYVKINKLYYFDKKKINYFVLAHVKKEYLNELLKIILSLSEEDRLSIITSNLNKS